jgi:hypothetical protein
MKQGGGGVQASGRDDDPADVVMKRLHLVHERSVSGIERGDGEQVEDAVAARPGERRGRDQLIQAPVGGFGDQDEEPAIG